MGRVGIDVIRSSKVEGRSGTHYANLTIGDQLPIPDVGDDVVVSKGKHVKVVRVERRLFHYLDDSLYLQLYFSKVE